MLVYKKNAIAAAMLAVSTLCAWQVMAEQSATLPVSYENVFDSAMNDPNVMVFYADQAFRKKDYPLSMRWMLNAAKYEHPGAIENVKYLIKNNFGTVENRDAVVEFLKYFAEDDVFAKIYLADFYRGDRCVWFSEDQKSKCTTEHGGPMSGNDMMQSYFYYESAAESGNERAIYSTGMMNLLGIGAPRNVAYGLSWLRPLAESGNASVAYIIGLVYQNGYWMPQDREEANKWFLMAAVSKLPGALLNLAKNAESGKMLGTESERINIAIGAYNDVIKGVLATDVERAEAAYRLGLVYSGYVAFKNMQKANENMFVAAELSDKTANEFSIKALVWIGGQFESEDLKKAVGYYTDSISVLRKVPIEIQQQQSSVFEKVAYAYGRGQKDNLDRDERLFAQFMQERRVIMAKSFIPKVDDFIFEGYSAFQLK
jgi:TPR repeat protein